MQAQQEIMTLQQAAERNINKTREILESLTLQQAKTWKATNEKYLYIDYEVVAQHGISLNSLRDDRLLNAIEARFEQLLAAPAKLAEPIARFKLHGEHIVVLRADNTATCDTCSLSATAATALVFMKANGVLNLIIDGAPLKRI